jgi:hypothetical protein
MKSVMCFRGNRQTIVDRVSQSQPARLEPKTREQRVSLNDTLKGRSHRACLARLHRRFPVIQERSIAQVCQSCCSHRAESADDVHAERVPRSLSFKPSGESIPHPCNQLPNRGFCDDARIHQNQIRVPSVEETFFKGSRGIVDNRERTTRRITGSGRWATDHRQSEGSRRSTSRIQRLPAPRTDETYGTDTLGSIDQPPYFRVRALTRKENLCESQTLGGE